MTFSFKKHMNSGFFYNSTRALTIEATLIWTRRYLEEHPEGEYSDIQKAFLSCFPEHFFNFDY
jgi:hypothetical protein